eukprot:scaffold201370_cov30-Prasinocladus_malaysianus.AAC.1
MEHARGCLLWASIRGLLGQRGQDCQDSPNHPAQPLVHRASNLKPSRPADDKFSSYSCSQGLGCVKWAWYLSSYRKALVMPGGAADGLAWPSNPVSGRTSPRVYQIIMSVVFVAQRTESQRYGKPGLHVQTLLLGSFRSPGNAFESQQIEASINRLLSLNKQASSLEPSSKGPTCDTLRLTCGLLRPRIRTFFNISSDSPPWIFGQ